MERAIPVAKDISWIGVNDRETDLFEGIWPLPRGVSYNSYIIVDDKICVIDTVKRNLVGNYLRNLGETLPEGRTPDYLIINHIEPDHSGSISVLRQIYPEITIIGNKKTVEFLEHMYGITDKLLVVADGDELSLGTHSLKFFVTPMVHWPETMMTYDQGEQVLFSGDVFGGFGAMDGGLFDDEVDVDYYDDEILRYFSNIVGKFSNQAQRALAKLADLNIKIIAATHGPVWRSNPQQIISDYDRWSRYEAEPGVVLVHASMYGNSTRMMEAVSRGLSEGGLSTVRIHDVCRQHVSFIIRDIWRYKGFILGSPTYDIGLFPRMKFLTDLLLSKKLKNRCLGIFGTYGWSGGAVKAMQTFAQAGKFKVVEPVVEARFAPTAEQLDQCREMGRKMAALVKA